MSIPEHPSEKGFFSPQQGYNLKVKTQKYSDKPTPIAATQGKAAEFLHNQTDREHQKKYAKEGGKRLFQFIMNNFCH